MASGVGSGERRGASATTLVGSGSGSARGGLAAGAGAGASGSGSGSAEALCSGVGSGVVLGEAPMPLVSIGYPANRNIASKVRSFVTLLAAAFAGHPDFGGTPG